MGSHALGWLAVRVLLRRPDLRDRFARAARAGVVVAATPLLVAGGLALHFADLLHRARELSSVPYRTLGGSVSFFGWMLGIAYLALALRHRERATGPFLIPVDHHRDRRGPPAARRAVRARPRARTGRSSRFT